jgi:prolyl-tRNA editing enzyme YbaK/EbsC (Cys-tRNA(Pro) deacylase)
MPDAAIPGSVEPPAPPETFRPPQAAEPDWFAHLELAPAANRPELLGAPVRAALAAASPPGAVLVAPIDAALADTAAFCEHYQIPVEVSANCVVVAGRRDGEERWAAAVVLATTRADVNNVIRRRLDVRKISFAPMDAAVERTGMAYGGITPIGLPAGWPILVDAAVATAGPVVIGSGIRGSKIVLDGALLATLPGAEIVDGLARSI